MSFVYYIAAPALDLVKIGFAENPVTRMSKIASDCPVPVALLATEIGDQALEAAMHSRFAESRRRAEWFQLSGPVADYIATLAPFERKRRDRLCTDIAQAVGISAAQSSRIMNGKSNPPLHLAIRIYRTTGWKTRCLEGFSEDEINVLERYRQAA